MKALSFSATNDNICNIISKSIYSLIRETNIILSTTNAKNLENVKWIDRLFDVTMSLTDNFELAKIKYRDGNKR